MLRDNRVLLKKAAGSFQDLSPALSDIHAQTKVIDLSPGDYLYLASYLPHNHRYFDVSVVNDQDSSIVVEYWNGNAWVPFVDVVDETSVNGKTLAQDGIVSWRLDPLSYSWGWADTPNMSGSGLTTLKIYGLYWTRISFSAALKNTTALNYVGHKFSEDPALEAEYPELARSALKTAWKAGKTDWSEQTLLAAEYIVAELRGPRRKITSADQIMSWQLFEKASVHRTAMICFKGMGSDYEKELKAATQAYKDSMDIRLFEVDESRDGNLDQGEKENRVEWLTR